MSAEMQGGGAEVQGYEPVKASNGTYFIWMWLKTTNLGQ